MKNKKVIIIIVAIAVIAVLAGCISLLITTNRIKQYTKADEYIVGGEKIPSVKSAVGEKKIKKYSHSKTNIDTLKLTFIDSNKEETVKTYIESLKDNGNYIEMMMDDKNKRQLACPADELITVETELTDDGFTVTIEVGAGSIKINSQE